MNDANRWGDRLAAPLVALVGFALCLAPVSDPDLYFHLTAGRSLGELGRLQISNTWSFTAPGHPFPPSAWLFDWFSWAAFRVGGYAGVQLGCAAVVAGAFLLVYAGARRLGAGPTWAAAATLAAEAASVGRFTQRPQVVTWLFLAVVALLLREARRGSGRAPLVAVPLLVAVWGNFHAGVVFGAVLAGTFAIALVLERRARPTPPGGNTLRAFLACAAATSVAAFLNPAGPELLTNAISHLGRSGVIADIIEFQPPTLVESRGFFVLLALAVMAQVRRWRALDLGEGLLILAFGAAALHERRNLVECLVLLTPPLAARAQALTGPSLVGGRAAARIALAVLFPPAVFLATLSMAREPLASFATRIEVGENPWRVPTAAAAFVREQGISGRCFTSMDLGAFVEWELPESKIFHDPRLLAYPPAVFEELGRVEGDPKGFDALVDRHQIEWSIRSHRNYRYSGIGVFPSERWALIYWDEVASVRVRRDLPRFEALIREHEILEFLPGTSEGELWSGTTGERRGRLVAEMAAAAQAHPALSSAHNGLCLEHASQQRFEEAQRACSAATRAFLEHHRFEPLEGQRRRRELAIAWSFLGQRLRLAGQGEAARVAYEGALALSPDSAPALVGLGATWREENPERARELFREALKARPGFAPARAALLEACRTVLDATCAAAADHPSEGGDAGP